MSAQTGGQPASGNAVGSNAAVSSGAETQNPAPEIVEEVQERTSPAKTDDAEGVEGAAATDETEHQGDDTERALKRMQKRIDKRTADVYRERARAEELARRVEQLESKTRTETEEQPKDDPVTMARHIAAVERFTEKSNQLVDQGTKKHADYMTTMKELALEVGPFVNRDETPSPFMAVVLEVSEKPSELLYHLGKNLDIASDLSGLNQIQLAKRLDRIERDMLAPKSKTSSAPKPLEPVNGKGGTSELSSDLPTDEWMRRREAQIKAARGR